MQPSHVKEILFALISGEDDGICISFVQWTTAWILSSGFDFFENSHDVVRPVGIFLSPANEVAEGNVFTPVCDSVHRSGLCPAGRVSIKGSLPRAGGGSPSRGVTVRETPRTVKSRRYTSYWNASLIKHLPNFCPEISCTKFKFENQLR